MGPYLFTHVFGVYNVHITKILNFDFYKCVYTIICNYGYYWSLPSYSITKTSITLIAVTITCLKQCIISLCVWLVDCVVAGCSKLRPGRWSRARPMVSRSVREKRPATATVISIPDPLSRRYWCRMLQITCPLLVNQKLHSYKTYLGHSLVFVFVKKRNKHLFFGSANFQYGDHLYSL